LFMHFLGASRDGLVARRVDLDTISSSVRNTRTTIQCLVAHFYFCVCFNWKFPGFNKYSRYEDTRSTNIVAPKSFLTQLTWSRAEMTKIGLKFQCG